MYLQFCPTQNRLVVKKLMLQVDLERSSSCLFLQGPSTKLLNSIRRMYSPPQEFPRHDVFRPEFRYGMIRQNYPRTVRSPPVRSNLPWRQPLPQRPVLQPQGLPNGSIPNSPETYNGGHGSGVSLQYRTLFMKKFLILIGKMQF